MAAPTPLAIIAPLRPSISAPIAPPIAPPIPPPRAASIVCSPEKAVADVKHKNRTVDGKLASKEPDAYFHIISRDSNFATLHGILYILHQYEHVVA